MKIKTKNKEMKITARVLKPRLIKKPMRSSRSKRGVVYISHVPHGFYEKEMKGFFGQFGKVTAVKVGRSSRTGNSRGFAFVEFEYDEVAKIVAQTMDNYLMFNRILKVKHIPPKEQKPHLFRMRRPLIPMVVKRRLYLKEKSHRTLDEDEQKQEEKQIQRNLQKAKRKLEKHGIKYDFMVYAGEESSQSDAMDISVGEESNKKSRDNPKEKFQDNPEKKSKDTPGKNPLVHDDTLMEIDEQKPAECDRILKKNKKKNSAGNQIEQLKKAQKFAKKLSLSPKQLKESKNVKIESITPLKSKKTAQQTKNTIQESKETFSESKKSTQEPKKKGKGTLKVKTTPGKASKNVKLESITPLKNISKESKIVQELEDILKESKNSKKKTSVDAAKMKLESLTPINSKKSVKELQGSGKKQSKKTSIQESKIVQELEDILKESKNGKKKASIDASKMKLESLTPINSKKSIKESQGSNKKQSKKTQDSPNKLTKNESNNFIKESSEQKKKSFGKIKESDLKTKKLESTTPLKSKIANQKKSLTPKVNSKSDEGLNKFQKIGSQKVKANSMSNSMKNESVTPMKRTSYSPAKKEHKKPKVSVARDSSLGKQVRMLAKRPRQSHSPEEIKKNAKRRRTTEL